jgi:hypothetical protein
MKAYVLLVLGLIVLAACDKQPAVPQEPQVPSESCSDGIRNQAETDTDCGGPCGACIIGMTCANDGDCSSEFCNDQHTCEVTSCYDGKWNGRETGTDCGGPCPACESCNDGVKNQDETGTDCGGKCTACPVEPYTLNDVDRDALKTKLKLNTKATFLSDVYPTGLGIGESHVFALGITNTNLEPETFTVTLSFDKARNSMNNAIDGVDVATVMTWLQRNSYGDFTLEKYGQAFLPVGITVGKSMSPGVTTQPGTYYFKANVLYMASLNDYDPYITVPFTVIVK